MCACGPTVAAGGPSEPLDALRLPDKRGCDWLCVMASRPLLSDADEVENMSSLTAGIESCTVALPARERVVLTLMRDAVREGGRAALSDETEADEDEAEVSLCA